MPSVSISTSTGSNTGEPVDDAFGTKTASAGTVITRVIPPKTGARTRATGFSYIAAATAHTLSFMVCMDGTTALTTDAESGQAVINLNRLPQASDGSAIAANDWVVLRYEDGSWSEHMVSSLSGLAVTLSANLTAKVLSGSTVYFMGAPADHANRQFTCAASVTTQIVGSPTAPLAAGAAVGSPMVVHSNNATNAGTLTWLSFAYTDE